MVELEQCILSQICILKYPVVLGSQHVCRGIFRIDWPSSEETLPTRGRNHPTPRRADKGRVWVVWNLVSNKPGDLYFEAVICKMQLDFYRDLETETRATF